MRIILALLALLSLFGCDHVVYVYADGGPQLGGDAGPQPLGDAAPQGDAWAASDGTCLPDRTPGEISSADCHRYAATPVCDGLTATCAPAPRAFCDPCETDAQCQTGVDLHAQCVFLGRAQPYPSDQACLSPCTTVADCGFLGWPATSVQCMQLGTQGSFCVVPFADGTPTCSDGQGGRR